MKHIKISFLSVFIFLVLSAIAFAMGGPAPEQPKEETPAIQPQTAEAQPVVQPITVTKEAEMGDFDKAQAELTSLEAERERIDIYLETLNKKIIKAKISKDEKKLSQLQEIERTMSDREKLVTERISSIKQKYYILKPVGGSEAPQKEQKPEQIEKPKIEKPKAVSQNIVYHVVAAGDTLMSVSRKYFNGSASYYRQIAEMNGLTGASPLKVGMKLKIDKNMKLKPKKPSL
jgi:hypothetical protein